MNILMIAALSGVFLLAGCKKNEPRRSAAPKPAAAAPENPSPNAQGANAKVLPPDVSLTDRELQTQYGNDSADRPADSTDIVPPQGSTDVVTPNVQIPRVEVPRVDIPAVTVATGVTNRPLDNQLDIQPSRPVEIIDASPAGPERKTVSPVAASVVDQKVETESSPTYNAQEKNPRRGQEQRFRPIPMGETKNEKLNSGTGPATTNATIVVVAPTGAPLSAKITAKDFKVFESKAYTEKLAPLLKKIRALHTATADRLEKTLKETQFKAVESSMMEATDETKNDALIAGFQAPAGTEYNLVHLKSSVLLSAMDLKEPTATAKLILESVLLRAAYETASQKDAQFMASVLGLSRSIADSFLKNAERLNQRMVYEYLRYAQINTSDWTFEQLDAVAASTAILRLSLRQFTVTMAEPKDAFNVTPIQLDDPKAENCSVNITYHGIEEGVRVMISEPEWREYEFKFDVQSKETYPLRPSMAGDQFQDLEIISKRADKTSLRLTVRYAVVKKGEGSEREADHMVLEKLPEKGKAEKILMCKIVAHEYVPPRAKTEDEKAADAKNQEGLTSEETNKAVTAATGKVTGANAATAAILGQEQHFRPMPTATDKATTKKRVTPVTAPAGDRKTQGLTTTSGAKTSQQKPAKL